MKVLIEKAEVKSGTTNGKDWKFYNVKLGDPSLGNKGYVTCNDEGILSLVGKEAEIELSSKPNGNYVNHYLKIVDVTPAPVNPTPINPTPANGGDLTPQTIRAWALREAVQLSNVVSFASNEDEIVAKVKLYTDKFIGWINNGSW